MLNFTYENQGVNTYLVYELKGNDVIDTLAMGMMANNNITGLAPMIYTQLNNQRYIKYNISSKVALNQLLLGTVSKKRIMDVFSSITEALLTLEEYMIDIDTAILDIEHIYADVSTNRVLLIILPINSESLGAIDHLEFYKKIMYGIQFDQKEDSSYVAKIINFLNSSTVFSLEDFKHLIDSIMKEEIHHASFTNQDKQRDIIHNNQKEPTQNSHQNSHQSSHQNPHQNSHQNSVIAAQQPQQSIMRHQDIEPNGMQQKKPMDEKKKWSLFKIKNAANEPKKQKEPKKIKAPKNVRNIPGNPNVTTSQPLPPPVSPHIPPVGQSLPPVGQPLPPAGQAIPPAGQPIAPVSHSSFQNRENSGHFGETTVLSNPSSVGETTVLGIDNSTKTIPCLVRLKNNEKIKLDKSVFRIGKEKSYVDYFIGDNTAVSRSHANIVNHSDDYYVIDTNSTNHTFVNDKIILSNTEVRLTHGTRLRLANEEFEFRIY